MRHIIAILLQNEAGALSRVAGLFSTRGYNIESLSVAPTDDATVSRITLVTTGSEAVIQQILNQLNKLIDVVSVEDMTGGEHLERELVLLKLKVRPEQTDAVRGYVVRTGGRVLDPAMECFIVELTASEAEINSFIADLARLMTEQSGGIRVRYNQHRPRNECKRPQDTLDAFLRNLCACQIDLARSQPVRQGADSVQKSIPLLAPLSVAARRIEFDERGILAPAQP